MLVTINTDASFHHKYKKGAFAFWIVSDRGKWAHCGPLKGECANPTLAELMCIINSLYVLFLKTDWKNINKIIINTDSLNSIMVLENDRAGIAKYGLHDKYYATYRQRLKHLKKKYSATGYKGIIEFRHVKSHSGTEEARKWVNDWCDRNAKEQLWKLLHKLHPETIPSN
jgi:ribonuclease HI